VVALHAADVERVQEIIESIAEIVARPSTKPVHTVETLTARPSRRRGGLVRRAVPIRLRPRTILVRAVFGSNSAYS